jgi:hypothetical protein
MMVTGSFTSQFKSPPPYLSRPISIKDNARRSVNDFRMSVQNKGRGRVGFSLPSAFNGGSILIVDATGKTIRKLAVERGMTLWNGLDNGKSRARTGMYFAMIEGPRGAAAARISIVAP